MGTKKPTSLYKLTSDGQSPHTGFNWSLPTKDGPGEWHDVQGDLVPHRNAFHLTSDPKEHWRNGLEVWLVETEGEVVRVRDDEWCARKVRLVRRLAPADLDKLNVGVSRSWRSSSRAPTIRKRIPEGKSPAVRLMTLVHDHALTSGNRKGENLFDSCMAKALDLVVEARMEFGVDDVATISKLYDRIGCEWRYGNFVTTGNISACKSWEQFVGRAPWMWQGGRLYQGARLPWGGRDCKVTTIGRDKLIVCAYREERGEDDTRREGSIEKRYTITREELLEGDRRWRDGEALREEIKATREALKKALGDVDEGLIAVWSPEERAAARTWAVFQETDRGKARVQAPERPACVERDHAVTMAWSREYRETMDAYYAKPWQERGERPQPQPPPSIGAAREAVQAWHAAMFVGVPADYLKKLGTKRSVARAAVKAAA